MDMSLDDVIAAKKEIAETKEQRASMDTEKGIAPVVRSVVTSNISFRRENDRPRARRNNDWKSHRYNNTPRGNVDGTWKHDLFVDETNKRQESPERRRFDDRVKRTSGYRVSVANLYYEVTSEDLQELFSSVGPLVRVQITFDQAGRSTGEATVEFESLDDAKLAVKEYHGAELDGQKMALVLAEPSILSRLSDTRASGSRLAGRLSGVGGASVRPSPYDRRDGGFERRRNGGFDRNREDSGW
jgi:THO complex subunit 4